MIQIARRKWVVMFCVAAVLLSASSVVAQDENDDLEEWQADELIPVINNIYDAIEGVGEVVATEDPFGIETTFFKGVDGNVYVPFTVSLNASQVTTSELALYVFLADRAPAAEVEGEEEEEEEAGPPDSVFASGYFVDASVNDDGKVEFSRAFQAPGGEYDLYMAIRDSSGGDEDAGEAIAVAPITLARQTLNIPDQWSEELQISTVLLAAVDDIQQLPRMPTADELRESPFTFGNTRIAPRFDGLFTQEDRFSMVFFVYNPGSQDGTKPDLSVELSFHTQTDSGEEYFNQATPMQYNSDTLDGSFDITAGH